MESAAKPLECLLVDCGPTISGREHEQRRRRTLSASRSGSRWSGLIFRRLLR